jgi:hypothetical protein
MNYSIELRFLVCFYIFTLITLMVFMNTEQDTDYWQNSSLEIMLFYLHWIYGLKTQADCYATYFHETQNFLWT